MFIFLGIPPSFKPSSFLANFLSLAVTAAPDSFFKSLFTSLSISALEIAAPDSLFKAFAAFFTAVMFLSTFGIIVFL